MTKLSIGILCHNSEKYLEKVFENLLKQTYQDYTVIVSDNNSNDKTCDILEYYSKRFPNFQIYRFQKTVAVEENFCKVLELCQTEYFCWMADDDWYSESWIEVLMSGMNKKSLVFGTVQYVNHSGQKLRSPSNGRNLSVGYGQNWKLLALPEYFGKMIVFWGIYPTSLLKSNLGEFVEFNREFGADLALVYDIVRKLEIKCFTQVKMYKRVHNDSDNAKTAKIKTTKHFKVFLLICEIFNLRNLRTVKRQFNSPKMPNLFILILARICYSIFYAPSFLITFLKSR